MPRDFLNSSISENSRLATELPIENYSQALGKLYDRIDYERIGHAAYTNQNYRLDRMRQLLDLLGTPQLSYPIVHIAGTKGKGTVATLVYDCLRACGLKSGLYTSPHLLRLEERIQIDGNCCSESELIELTRDVLDAASKLEAAGRGRSTFFELTTAMGLLHFAKKSADVVVLEVGLGGRLDSTNVCTPVVSVITSISLDHQAQLGNTIQAIAAEKAGIIKPGIPVVCTARETDARTTVQRVAAEHAAPLILLDRDFRADWKLSIQHPPSPLGSVAEIQYSNSDGSTSIKTQMLGRHQADNVAGAMATLDILRSQNWTLPSDRVVDAIAQSCPRARLEVVGTSPIQIIDTAHNPVSIQAGLEAINEHFSGKRKTILFASSRDKDYRAMLRLLLDQCEDLILTAYHQNPRALPSAELASVANEMLGDTCTQDRPAPNVHHADTPAAAWELAAALTTTDGVILATGSFFLAAELLPLVEERHSETST